jgi:hypothetical protein
LACHHTVANKIPDSTVEKVRVARSTGIAEAREVETDGVAASLKVEGSEGVLGVEKEKPKKRRRTAKIDEPEHASTSGIKVSFGDCRWRYELSPCRGDTFL